jgi:hypothetical protein
LQVLAVRSNSQSVARHLGHASASQWQLASPVARVSPDSLSSCLRSQRNARAGRALASLAQPAPALLGGTLGAGSGHQQNPGLGRLGVQAACHWQAGFREGPQSSPGLSLARAHRPGLASGTKPSMQFAPGSPFPVFGRRRAVTKEQSGTPANRSAFISTRCVVVANPSVEATNCGKPQFAPHLER